MKTYFENIVKDLKDDKIKKKRITHEDWKKILILNLPEEEAVVCKDIGYGVVELYLAMKERKKLQCR